MKQIFKIFIAFIVITLVNQIIYISEININRKVVYAETDFLRDIVSVAGGYDYSVALKNDGTVWSWGKNTYGQLGDGTNIDKGVPVQVLGLTGVKAIAIGNYHSLALKTDGTVWSWGRNYYGQLGDGTKNNRLSPVKVSGLTSIKAIGAGSYHSVALKSDGTIWTWGRNNYGQLGIYTGTTERSSPTKLTSISGVKSIAIGSGHNIVLKSDGTVWAWGSNYQSQLGYSTSETYNYTPKKVYSLRDVQSIYAGDSHNIVMKEDGTIWSWGYNSNGQLGDGTRTNSLTPKQIEGLTDIKFIAAGVQHSVALNNDGQLFSWGGNKYGQLGNKSTVDSSIPIIVKDKYNFIGIDSGSYHNIAVKNNGTVCLWGYNNSGQLGNGRVIKKVSPTAIVGLNDIINVESGADHNIVLKKDGTIWTWGRNHHGQLGNGKIANFGGDNIPSQIADLGKFKNIAAGFEHCIAIKQNGTVWSWGNNKYGQLGDGSTVERYSPVQVTELNNMLVVEAGQYYTIALKDDGTVWSWGRNEYGQLGDGSKTNSYRPVQVKNIDNIISISAGQSHCLALKNDGTVWSWGYNSRGRLGDGTTTSRESPIQIPNLADVKLIVADKSTSFALKNDGTIWAWGENSCGQYGDGTTAYSTVPKQVTSLIGVANIVVGNQHSIALKEDGTVLAWGLNGNGQIGDGTTETNYNPNQITVLSNIQGISAGGSHSTAFDKYGKVWTWGSNYYSQTGDIYSEIYVTQPMGIFGSIPEVSGLFNNDSFELSYMPVGGSIYYQVEIDGEVYDNEVKTIYTNENINPNSIHVYRVRSVNENYVEQWSNYCTTETKIDIVTTVSNDSVTLSWDGVTNATGYELKIDDVYKGLITENGYNFSDIENYKLRKYDIRAILDVNGEKYYGIWNSKKYSSLGEAKLNSLDDNSISVEFNVNDLNICDSYKVLVNGNESTDWKVIEHTNNIIRISDLAQGEEHHIVIQCKLKDQEEYIIFDETVETKSQKIDNVETMVKDNSNIEIVWKKAENANRYDLMRNDEIIATSIDGLNYLDTDSSIINTQLYRVRPVYFKDGNIHYGQWSDPATYVPENYKLETINSGQALLKNNEIEVSWPAISGAINYIIKVDNNSIVDLQNNSTNFIDQSSDIHKKHTYQIQTVYGNGENRIYSDFGAPIVYNPKLSYPGEVTNGYAYLGENGYINLQWKAANPADEYEIKINNGDNYTRTNTTSLVITSGADVKDNHVIQVRAICIDGLNKLYGEWSTPIEYIAPQTKPDKVSGLNVQVNSKKITLNWNSSERADQYEIEMNGKMVAITNGLVHIHSNCDYDIPYIFRIRAKNEGGYSAWVTSEIVVINKPSLPDVSTPIILKKHVENNKISLQWSSVDGAETYNIKIVNTLEDGSEVSAKELDCGDKTYMVVNGLEPGNNYNIELRAKNSNSISSPVSTGQFTTFSLDTPVVQIAEPAELGSIKLKWGEVEGANSYTVELKSSSGTELHDVTESETTIENLNDNTAYTVRVKAVNNAEESNYSYKRIIYTWSDKVLKDINAIASQDSIKLSWGSIEPAPLGYEIEIDGIVVDNGTKLNYNLNNLLPYTQHTMRVRAKYRDITTNWSDMLTVFTLPDLDIYPDNIKISTDALPVISWIALPGAIGYRIEIDKTTIDIGNSTEYIHRQRIEGKENVYRVQAYYPYGDGKWSQRLINNNMRAEVTSGNNLMLGLTGEHIIDFNKYLLEVTYNKGVLKISDLCTLSYKKEMSTGKIDGTNITIVEFSPGSITFYVENSHDENYAWTGVLNSIEFIGVMDGGTYINYTVHEKENLS